MTDITRLEELNQQKQQLFALAERFSNDQNLQDKMEQLLLEIASEEIAIQMNQISGPVKVVDAPEIDPIDDPEEIIVKAKPTKKTTKK